MTEASQAAPRRLVDLFSFSGRVDRRTYFVTGVCLMALKVAVDVTLYRFATGTWAFPPFAFNLAALVERDVFVNGPGMTAIVILAWSVPFIWIGTAMSARRSSDAAISAGWAALFVVPFVSYVLILVLCLLPSRTAVPKSQRPPPLPGPRPVHPVIAGACASVPAGVLLWVSVYVLKSYGVGLFVGAPLVFGAVCAFVANLRASRSMIMTLAIVNASVAVFAVAVILVALEGAVCIVMAAPIAFFLANLGGFLGYAMSAGCRARADAGPFALMLPALFALDGVTPAPAPHEVLSSIEIDAPPEVVWRHVVGFDEILDPPTGLFRTGLACPLRATIDGTGVGAVRRCEFTTGTFVEPVTVWDEPRRLAFDVAAEPPPLVEWSPYSAVHAPHLDGYFRSLRGEFRLVPLDGGSTLLEGRTWYVLDIAPRAYWHVWADELVHEIHLRVLRHIARLAEAE